MYLSAQPIFTNDNRLTLYGEFGKHVDINVYDTVYLNIKEKYGTEVTNQFHHQLNIPCQTHRQ